MFVFLQQWVMEEAIHFSVAFYSVFDPLLPTIPYARLLTPSLELCPLLTNGQQPGSCVLSLLGAREILLDLKSSSSSLCSARLCERQVRQPALHVLTTV